MLMFVKTTPPKYAAPEHCQHKLNTGYDRGNEISIIEEVFHGVETGGHTVQELL